MVWATGVVNITCQEKEGLGYWCCQYYVSGERWPGLLVLLILRVSRKMVWATGVVNSMCQEKDGLGYWCC